MWYWGVDPGDTPLPGAKLLWLTVDTLICRPINLGLFLYIVSLGIEAEW